MRRRKASRSPKHLNLIRQLPCILSGRPAEVAHVSFSDLTRDKPHRGKGQRAGDKWTVPLCPELHRLNTGCQHSMNEFKWWDQFSVDPLTVAAELWEVSGDHYEMSCVIARHMPQGWAERQRIREILRGSAP